MSRIPLVLMALALPPSLGAQQPDPLPRLGELQVLAAELQLHAAGLRMQVAGMGLERLAALGSVGGPPALDPDSQDPADGLYRQAREALNRSEYARAVELFGQIRSRYPRSAHTPDSYYWEAFAQHRRGTTETLRLAQNLLAQQAQRHPDAATRGEARTLEIRIEGDLARRGDAAAAEALASRGSMIVPPTPPTPPTPPVGAAPPVPPVPPATGRATRCAGEDEEQVMVLNGLMNMDADRALPLLERVLARRDAESACLRRRAIFLVSQKRGERAETMLLSAARSDPDPEVREQAVFWLGQSGGPRAAALLDSILRTSTDSKIQVRAIFSLAQMNAASSGPVLRSYAGRSDLNREVRDQAIFWLGQSGNAENAQFLQELYRRDSDVQLKERILFAVSQMPRRSGASYGQWLAGIAANANEPIALRKKAIFWAGQSGAPLGELIQAYDGMPEVEMKEQVIFVLSQRRETEATDKLIAIARSDSNPKLRERAMFWLSQRNDPRVTQLMLEILERRPPGE